MPELVKLFLRSSLVGFIAACLFVAVLLAVDLAGLRRAASGRDGQILILMIVWSGTALFGGAVFALSVFRLRDRDEVRR